jgi:hypothetical protein
MYLDAGTVVLRDYEHSDADVIIGRILTVPEIMIMALDERSMSKEDARVFVEQRFNVR